MGVGSGVGSGVGATGSGGLPRRLTTTSGGTLRPARGVDSHCSKRRTSLGFPATLPANVPPASAPAAMACAHPFGDVEPALPCHAVNQILDGPQTCARLLLQFFNQRGRRLRLLLLQQQQPNRTATLISRALPENMPALYDAIVQYGTYMALICIRIFPPVTLSAVPPFILTFHCRCSPQRDVG